jgi:ABC-type uncharacterized transport system substrate-binding protein
MFRRAAFFVDKILRGRQARRPLHRAAQHSVLAINLKAANALGLTIPPSLLLRAGDESG